MLAVKGAPCFSSGLPFRRLLHEFTFIAGLVIDQATTTATASTTASTTTVTYRTGSRRGRGPARLGPVVPSPARAAHAAALAYSTAP